MRTFRQILKIIHDINLFNLCRKTGLSSRLGQSSLLVPRSRVADRGTIESGSVRLSVCRAVCQQFSYTFYSALDLPQYWEESNETLDNGRIYIVVVHLGIGFIERRKMCR